MACRRTARTPSLYLHTESHLIYAGHVINVGSMRALLHAWVPTTSYLQVTYGSLYLFYVHGFTFLYASYISSHNPICMVVCASFTCLALRSFTLPISSHILPTSHVINVGSLYEGSFTCMALLTNPFLYASYIFP